MPSCLLFKFRKIRVGNRQERQERQTGHDRKEKDKTERTVLTRRNKHSWTHGPIPHPLPHNFLCDIQDTCHQSKNPKIVCYEDEIQFGRLCFPFFWTPWHSTKQALDTDLSRLYPYSPFHFSRTDTHCFLARNFPTCASLPFVVEKFQPWPIDCIHLIHIVPLFNAFMELSRV